MIVIERIDTEPTDRLNALVMEADATGFNALSRMLEDWRSGRNQFNQLGETLLIATDSGCVVGVCGLNRDPYLSDSMVGRVRHLYVAVDHRRIGIGSPLVRVVIGAASGHFARLRLRTDSPDADSFYRSLKFVPFASEPACSHQLVLIDEGGPRTSRPWLIPPDAMIARTSFTSGSLACSG